MRCRSLGLTGIKVSSYTLGALMLGAPIGNSDHDDSIRLIHKAARRLLELNLVGGFSCVCVSRRRPDSESWIVLVSGRSGGDAQEPAALNAGLSRSSDSPQGRSNSACVEDLLDVFWVAGEHGVARSHNDAKVAIDDVRRVAECQDLTD